MARSNITVSDSFCGKILTESNPAVICVWLKSAQRNDKTEVTSLGDPGTQGALGQATFSHFSNSTLTTKAGNVPKETTFKK